MSGLRRGFTLVEMMVVMVVIGLLASIVTLKYIDLSRTAYAAKVVGEFTTIRLAAYNYEADHNNVWPADVAGGVTPPEMIPYLPQGFSFVAPTYTLDWENRSPSLIPFELAITLTSSDPALMNALRQNLGNNAPYFFSGDQLTYVLVDESGNY
jgi:prepilin-type N-terminal cleavage/methylation domain-containing protein